VVAIPSISEGFGLPVLEAMAAGGAVLTSSTSSMPEVGGDGAHYVHPFSVEGLAEGLRRMIHDHELNATLRENGLRRATAYSWEETARLTVAAYRRVAEG
jgi:glycosyltransferase involved in cell wall biosynthesis